MKKTIFIKFEVFDESIKDKAMMVVSDCPGVSSVKVQEQGILKVKGDFDESEMMKKLKMLDEHVYKIEFGPDGVEVPEVNKLSAEQPYGLWEQAKNIGAGAAEQAKVIGASAAEHAKIIGEGAAEQAKVIGASAAKQAIVIGVGAAGLILPNNRENGIKKQPKEHEVHAAGMGKRFGWDQPQPEKGGGIVKGVLQYLGKGKTKEEARRRAEEMRQNPYPTNHWMNMNNVVARKKEGDTTQGQTQGSTTLMEKTGSAWNTLSTLLTGEAGTSKQPQTTGQANTSTQVQRTTQTHKKKSKPIAKKGKNGN